MRVIVALVAGVLFGYFCPETAIRLKLLADIFIQLIKMVIVPIIFCTIAIGIGTMKNMKKMGKIGGKAMLYFEIMTTFALMLGLAVVHFVGPGRGFDISAAEGVDLSSYVSSAYHSQSVGGIIKSMFPDNVIGALARGDILPVLLTAILFGLALAKLGERVAPVTRLLECMNQIFFSIVSMVMVFSPIGVFGAMAYTIGKFGIRSLLPLVNLAACGYLTMILFVVIILGAVARFYGFSLVKILRYLKDEILLVIGTSSSETALPSLMHKLEKAGCSTSVVGLVVPTGYSFNLDGTAIYLSMSVLFIAQAYGIQLSIPQILLILVMMMVTSKGAAAVPGSGFITLAATLISLPGHPIPVQGIALLLGIDRFMSEARATTNLIGNAVATFCVSKMENEFHGVGIVES